MALAGISLPTIAFHGRLWAGAMGFADLLEGMLYMVDHPILLPGVPRAVDS